MVDGSHLSVKEAAAVLGLSRKTLYSWIEDGLFPAVNISPVGGRPCLRIRRQDLKRFEQERVEATARGLRDRREFGNN